MSSEDNHSLPIMGKQVIVHVQEPFFSDFQTGKKMVEGRLNRGKYSTINIGDKLILTEPNSGKTIVKKVSVIVRCNDFRELFFLYRGRLLPMARSEFDAYDVYSGIYSDEDVKEYGVLGFILK